MLSSLESSKVSGAAGLKTGDLAEELGVGEGAECGPLHCNAIRGQKAALAGDVLCRVNVVACKTQGMRQERSKQVGGLPPVWQGSPATTLDGQAGNCRCPLATRKINTGTETNPLKLTGFTRHGSDALDPHQPLFPTGGSAELLEITGDRGRPPHIPI
mmetsp:Transcript_36044/g.85522  ORF Transcript_36044/g.85522 Transcript_36044/m.85522 type:complete len:158 (-) Transcript_36044:99-572(-)